MDTSRKKAYVTKALISEFLGTAAIVGSCSLLLSKANTYKELAITAIVCGAVVSSVIYALGKFSGGHANPLVTLGFASGGRMHWGLAAGYIISQLLGGIFALIITAYFVGGFDQLADFNAGSLFDTDNIKLVIVSALMTMAFVGGFLFVTGNPYVASGAGLAIGIIFAVTALLGYNYAGDTLIPAYGMFSGGGNWKGKAFILLGSVVGALIAGLVWRLFNYKPWEEKVMGSCGTLKDPCGREYIKVRHERLDDCGKPIKGECGKPEYYYTTKVRGSKHDHHQRTVLSEAAKYVEGKTGMNMETMASHLHDGAQLGMNKLMKA